MDTEAETTEGTIKFHEWIGDGWAVDKRNVKVIGLVQVRRSKGDQEGRGAKKGFPYAARPGLCAVRALAAWLEAGGITSVPIFRAERLVDTGWCVRGPRQRGR